MAEILIKLTLNDIPEGAVAEVKEYARLAVGRYYQRQVDTTQEETNEIVAKTVAFKEANK